jgi:hypothetical protein
MSDTNQKPQQRGWLWPGVMLAAFLALVAGVVIVAVSIVHSCAETPRRTMEAVLEPASQALARIAGAFKPEVQFNTTITSAIGKLSDQGKLVVLTAEVNVEVKKKITTATLWGYVYLGTTSAELKAEGNQVQYYIPLDKLSLQHLSYDPHIQCLIVQLPAPKLDERMVSVQSDPSRVFYLESTGWSQIDRLRGSYLHDEAQRDLLPSVLKEGQHPLLLERAKRNAHDLVSARFQELLSAVLRPGVTVEVVFNEPAPGISPGNGRETGQPAK